jgi:hypothetical protein
MEKTAVLMKAQAGDDETTGEMYTAWKKAPPHTPGRSSAAPAVTWDGMIIRGTVTERG